MDGIEQVQKVIAELKGMGYYSFQIEEIILEKTGTRHLGKLSREVVTELIEELEEQVVFARKCKTIK